MTLLFALDAQGHRARLEANKAPVKKSGTATKDLTDAKRVIIDYAAPGAMTRLRGFNQMIAADAFTTVDQLLAAAPLAVVWPVHDLIIQPDAVALLVLPADREAEKQLRRAEDIEAVLMSRDTRPLSEARAPEDRVVGTCRHFACSLDKGELRDAIDGEEHVKLAVGMAQLAMVDVDVADLGLGKMSALGHRLVDRQTRDAMADQAAMQARSRQLRDLDREDSP